jgi:DNA-directed RNA polymerase sigma subunit (sigma70/sigma32)
MTWHAQGLSFAEIGHRLGVSPEKLREIMAQAGVDPAEMDRPEHDDDKPNKADVR